MRAKIAKALRRAADYHPSNDRTIVDLTTYKMVKFAEDKDPIPLARITKVNDESTPRAMYQQAKKLYYSGQINSVDTTK